MYGSESPAESLAQLSSLDFYLFGLEKKIRHEIFFEMKITKRSDIRKKFPTDFNHAYARTRHVTQVTLCMSHVIY